MKIAAIILAYNESMHLERCLNNIRQLTNTIYVIDSDSTDNTKFIAKKYGASVLNNPWVNHSKQFNWALSSIKLISHIDWIIKVDADEYLSDKLINEIQIKVKDPKLDYDGFLFIRKIIFQGSLISYGGISSIKTLRLFRYGKGQCENRWMDEHIKIDGLTQTLKGEIIDENLNSLTWWTDKHNKYASREAVDLLNLEYHFIPHDSVASLEIKNSVGIKRWVKEHIYARLPSGFRAISYFLYRYFIRLGFLDGSVGFTFHFLQCFWYRYLVDAKVAEVKRYMKKENVDAAIAIEKLFGIKL